MTRPLYTTELLRLAASLPAPHALEREDGRAEVRSATCGSRIKTIVQLDSARRVEGLSMHVHACAFGQASAALVAQHGRGCTREDVVRALASLDHWLTDETDKMVPWPGIGVLEQARPRIARHGAILLPFRALLSAIEAAP